ncbi:MAG: glycoside hydrolase family 97 protein [Cyclobacteriaceae bacterium]|nr:glycoside hydrolase family 97 protein [Cyclobacteriaceae bacterium]
MKRILKLTLPILLWACGAYAKETQTLYSPDENLSVEVSLTEKIYYSVYFKGERVLEASPLTITIDNKALGADPKLVNSTQIAVDETLEPVWGSRKHIRDNYNQLKLDFEGNYSVEFRAYNQGVAYRFVTNLKEKQVTVNNEEVAFRFNWGVSAWMLDEKSYETNYKLVPLDPQEMQNFNNNQSKVFLPIVVQATPEVKVAVTEAGLYDYPSLFIDRGNDYENFLNGTFEKYALTTKTGGFSNYSQLADKVADYIAITDGTRQYPWRLLIISDDDRTFADCDLVWQLSKPSVIKETSWIEPGKVAWEWWHDYMVEGQDFKGGVNTDTYLYHIDFAAKYGLEYILIDWLWTDKYDLTLFNPDVDLKKITNYAQSKDVKVIVWAPGHTLHRQLDKALSLFVEYGVSGVKADFFGREDQTGIKMYEDIAKATARHKLLIDFHGSAKPTGLSRTYPNVINYEAVAGNEWNKLSDDKVTIAHRVMVPFTRSLQGPMDFTPGGMRNVQSGHKLRMTMPEVQGTRSGEMAMFVLYNEPLKMLCDAPSVYEREPEITGFISQIPTTWDDTKVLEASFGKYLIEARQSGETWYVAGMTGEEARHVNLDFSFLGEGTYAAKILKDGPNAARIGTDYLFEAGEISKDSRLDLKMAAGGGFVIHLIRQQ